jgi:hypothetical protein
VSAYGGAAVNPDTPTMPTVSIRGRNIIIRRGYTSHVVGYIDPIDADRAAAEIRGAIADAYRAGAWAQVTP